MTRLLVTAGTAIIVGFGAGWFVQSSQAAADCPTEDSCTIDYRDGSWHVEEVTP